MQCVSLKTILILIFSFVVAFHKGAFCQVIRYDFVLVNQPYTFPGDTSGCHHAEWRKRSLTDTTIATYTNYVCTTGKGFEEEVTCKDNHLRLKSAKYTDQGPYEFICDGVKTPVNLDVLYAQTMSAEEMDNITLNCYAHNDKDVTWLHKDRVLHYKMGGSVNASEGYEGRASLEKNCFKTGDFSLSITRVRKEDAGIFRCFVGDGTTKGNPHAHLLHVTEKHSIPGGDQSDKTTLVIYQSLTIFFGLCSAIIAICWILTERKRRSTPTTNTQSTKDGTAENVSMLLHNVSPATPTNESQLEDNHPVQESNYMGKNPSNTIPF